MQKVSILKFFEEYLFISISLSAATYANNFSLHSKIKINVFFFFSKLIYHMCYYNIENSFYQIEIRRPYQLSYTHVKYRSIHV